MVKKRWSTMGCTYLKKKFFSDKSDFIVNFIGAEAPLKKGHTHTVILTFSS